MTTPMVYMAVWGFLALAAVSAKGTHSSFFQLLGRATFVLPLVGIGFIGAFTPATTLFVFIWFCFNLLSPLLKGTAMVASVLCELLFLIATLMPVLTNA